MSLIENFEDRKVINREDFFGEVKRILEPALDDVENFTPLSQLEKITQWLLDEISEAKKTVYEQQRDRWLDIERE